MVNGIKKKEEAFNSFKSSDIYALNTSNDLFLYKKKEKIF